jgi:hypothetical protein
MDNKQVDVKDLVDEYYKTFIGNDKSLKNQELYNLYTIPKKDKGLDKVHFPQIDKGMIDQVDILFLPDDKGYKYALVVADIGNRFIDAEPLKTKSSNATLEAIKTIYDRKIVEKPKVIQCDPGSEFKGEFKEWCNKQNIYVRYGKPGRHRQQAIVENANKMIGQALHKRMTAEELLTGLVSKSWVDELKDLITAINKKAAKRKPKPNNYDYPVYEGDSLDLIPLDTKVRVSLDEPIDVTTGKRLHGRFRASDIRFDPKIRYIKSYLFSPGQPVLYQLDGDDGPHKIDRSAAYTKNQLQIVPDNEQLPPRTVIKDSDDKYIVEKIVDERVKNKKKELLIKWKDYPESANTWEPYNIINEDVPQIVEQFMKEKQIN